MKAVEVWKGVYDRGQLRGQVNVIHSVYVGLDDCVVWT